MRRMMIWTAQLVALAGGAAHAEEPPLRPDVVEPDDRAGASDRRILALIDQLRDDDRWKVRMEAAVILGSSGDIRARQPLIRALDDLHYAVRAAAIRSLANIGDLRAIRPLVDRLGDDEAFVRTSARRALDSFDFEITRPYFMHALKRHPNPEVRLGAAEMLAESSDSASLHALLDAIGSEDEAGHFAEKAIRALPQPQAIALFLEGLAQADYGVQIASVRALAELETPLATEPFIALLDSEVPEVTLAATQGLHALAAHVDKGKWLVLAKRAGSRFERARALKVLGILGGEEAATLILNALDDPDVLVRGAAVNGVASLGDVRAIPKLEEMRHEEENGRILSLVRTTLSNLHRLRESQRDKSKTAS